MLDLEIVAMAKAKNFAMFTTIRADGHPATQVMWVDSDGEHLLINTEKHRRKFSNVLADPRVTVTLWDLENPYKYKEVRGVVVDLIEGAAARAHIDELSWKYFGRPYDPTIIQSERVVLRIRPITGNAKRETR